MLALRKRREARAQVRLIRSEESERVAETGAVASVQEAEVTMPRELVDELWEAPNLERLARSYWRWLSRAFLGLIRVVYTDESRAVVLLHPRLRLLHLPRARVRDRARFRLRHLADRPRPARRP